jgi:hypothetical protein
MSIEKSNDLIGNRNHDLPAFNIVPQPTMLSCATNIRTVRFLPNPYKFITLHAIYYGCWQSREIGHTENNDLSIIWRRWTLRNYLYRHWERIPGCVLRCVTNNVAKLYCLTKDNICTTHIVTWRLKAGIVEPERKSIASQQVAKHAFWQKRRDAEVHCQLMAR